MGTSFVSIGCIHVQIICNRNVQH